LNSLLFEIAGSEGLRIKPGEYCRVQNRHGIDVEARVFGFDGCFAEIELLGMEKNARVISVVISKYEVSLFQLK